MLTKGPPLLATFTARPYDTEFQMEFLEAQSTQLRCAVRCAEAPSRQEQDTGCSVCAVDAAAMRSKTCSRLSTVGSRRGTFGGCKPLDGVSICPRFAPHLKSCRTQIEPAPVKMPRGQPSKATERIGLNESSEHRVDCRLSSSLRNTTHLSRSRA